MILRYLTITLGSLLAVLLAAALYLGIARRDLLLTATGSVSHSLCDAAFLSHLDPGEMFREEQLPVMRSIGWAIRTQIDRQRQEARTTLLGGFAARSVYRPGLGCLLLHGPGPVPDAAGFRPARVADAFAPGVVRTGDPAIRRAIDQAFAEPDPGHPRYTKAVVVMHDGKLIAERYAPGYGPDTPIWVHSVTKSLTSALIGILVRKGKLRPDQPAPVAGWRAAGDPRHAITIDQLLRMDSGLPFDETSGPVNPLTRMLFIERDMAAYAARMPLAHAPGTVWGYSNLGFVLLGRVIRDAVGGDALDVERFARRELFAPLGMNHTVIESDATGTPIGASNAYASARDLARFGQLYLDDGVLRGKRILPAGWVAYSHSQTLATGYGAGFWTNRVNTGSVPVWHAAWGMPQLPRDMYYARGALGQYLIIVPSERLVVVRLGISNDYGTGVGDMVAAIIAALHAVQAEATPAAALR